jgi:hypothetical protein
MLFNEVVATNVRIVRKNIISGQNGDFLMLPRVI